MKTIRRVWAVLKKELIQLKRDRTTFAMIISIPIIQLILFGYAINTDPKHMPTAVITKDNGELARRIVSGLENTAYFAIQRDITADRVAASLLQKGDLTFVITIPPNFSHDILRGLRPSLLVEADATDPTATNNAIFATQGVVSAIASRELTGVFASQNKGKPAFDIEIHRLYNPEGITRYNIIPGLIGTVLTLTGVMMTALALTRERERGTMENLLAMPVKPFEIMAGKVIPYIIIGYIQAAIIVGTAVFLFGVPILGNLLLMAIALLAFIGCNLCLGFALSTAAKNQTQALQLAMFWFLPSLLLSGFMFPFQGMPHWAQTIGKGLPMTYFIRITRGIMLKGTEFADIWPNLWPLFLFLTIITLITLKLYQRTLD